MMSSVSNFLATENGITATTILLGMERATNSVSAEEENIGFCMAFSEANDAGGVLGRKIIWHGYSREFDQNDRQFNNVERLVEHDKVFALVNFGGPGAVQIAEFSEKMQVPYLFPHTGLISSENKRYVFTSFPKYSGEANLMFRYLAQERGCKQLGIVHAANLYGQRFLGYLKENASSAGYEFAGAFEVSNESSAEYIDGLRLLIDSGAQAIVMALHPKQAQILMQAKATLDWSEGRMVSAGPLTDEQNFNLRDNKADGTLGFCHFPDPATSPAPGFTDYRNAIFRYSPDSAYNRYSLYGYVYGKLIVEALRKAGRNLSREQFIDALENLGDWETGGVMPAFKLSKTNHHAQNAGFICEFKNGRFEDISGWISL